MPTLALYEKSAPALLLFALGEHDINSLEITIALVEEF
jgi:hypothetical protein